jgi:hypothetical protein
MQRVMAARVVSELGTASESDEAGVCVRVRDGSGSSDGRTLQSRATGWTGWKSRLSRSRTPRPKDASMSAMNLETGGLNSLPR